MFKSLQTRLVVTGLIPVAVLMAIVGVIGFVYIRDDLIDQWQEASLLKLERAGHVISMRLSRPLDLINRLKDSSDRPGGPVIQDWIIDQIVGMDGVVGVALTGSKGEDLLAHHDAERRQGMMRMMRFHRAEISEIGSPRFDAKSENETVDLVFSLKNELGDQVGRLAVTMRFDHLLQDLNLMGWWQSDMACLVDGLGTYLAHTGPMAVMMEGRKKLGDSGDPLETDLREKMGKNTKGTLLGSGHPPNQVAGFFRIKGTPWSIVMFAPGEEILTDILEFRNYYALAVSLVIVVILFFIRSVHGRVARLVTNISRAAKRVAEGDYGQSLAENGRDEFGILIRSFNAMVDGLKERDTIRDTFGRYMDPEVAKELMAHPDALKLGGDKRDVAILMSDIRGFTNIVESLSPEDTLRLLNRYLSHVIKAIHEHGGIIVDFFGDGILVFFDPIGGSLQQVVHRATCCARDMQLAVESFNAESRAHGDAEFPTAVGVHVGPVVVGNIGTETRIKHGIVGSAVNTASRIQSHATGGEIVVSDSVLLHTMPEGLIVDRTFDVTLKGIQDKVTLHAVRCVDGHNRMEEQKANMRTDSN